jgi:hypothetical protein
VLAEICADSAPVTVVIVGKSVAMHGHVSFAHGARAAVVLDAAVDDPEQLRGTVVITALSRGQVFSVAGQIRDASENSLSLDLCGDLRGVDPRTSERRLKDGDAWVSLAWGDEYVVGALRDVSDEGLAVLLPRGASLPPDGASVRVANGADGGQLEARVCHQVQGMDADDWVRVGLRLPAGSDARVLSTLSDEPSGR